MRGKGTFGKIVFEVLCGKLLIVWKLFWKICWFFIEGFFEWILVEKRFP
jgi:hypothetical protein